MPDQDYEYRGLMAEAWDLLRGDTSVWTDRLFYRAIIERQGGAALDIGCGTGRLLLDYLAAGIDVDGIDVSPEMLALCRSKAAELGLDVEGRLHLQTMETLALARRYRTIFVPSLSFQLLMDDAKADAAMRRFYEHLVPGGILALSLRSRFWSRRNVPQPMQWSDWAVQAEAERGDGVTIRRWSRERYDFDRRLLYEDNRYEAIRDGAIVATEFHGYSPAVCWYSQEEGLGFFERAGFTDLRITAEDGFEPATPDDSRFKITGVRP